MNDIVNTFNQNVNKKIMTKFDRYDERNVYQDFFGRSLDIINGLFNVNPSIVQFDPEQEVRLIDSFIACWKEYSQSIISGSEYYEGEYKKAVADFVKILEEERKKLDENISGTATED